MTALAPRPCTRRSPPTDRNRCKAVVLHVQEVRQENAASCTSADVHIDAAWEVRGTRRVWGMFEVEGDARGEVPAAWMHGLHEARSPEALAASFPHRTQDEIRQLSACLLGVTTWQKVCGKLGVDYSTLPRTVADAQALPR